MDNRPIGVFDSGLGGLTVVKELMAELPGEDIIYFGDTARIPYGTRSNETVIRYSKQCIKFLLSQGIKIIVIACNTASSISLDHMKELFNVPILGVIEPGAEEAMATTKNKRMGIIGTQGTIRSKAYESTVLRLDPEIQIFATPCSLFVPIVEEGWYDTKIALLTAKKYLDNMKDEGIDTLILGCTHYPLLSETISKAMGSGVTLVNPAKGTARKVKDVLRSHNILNRKSSEGEYSFFASDLGEKFEELGGRFLGREIKCAKKIDIEGY